MKTCLIKAIAICFLILSFLPLNILSAQEAYDEYGEWYDGKPIREIIFSGLSNVQGSELEALMNPYKGMPFSDMVFSEILGKLYALEYFDNIEPAVTRANPEGSEAVLRFTVTERPIVRRINFTGNSGVRRYELADVITTKVSDVFNQAKLRADVEAIRMKYLEKGYPTASITAEESRAADGVTITFRIVESEKISITRIDFQGNERFSSSVLRNQISLKARNLINDGAFQEVKLLQDREALLKYYRDRGYIDAAVIDVTRTYGSDNKGTTLVLTFMIEEGNEYRFGGITFEGNKIFSTEQLDRLVSSKTGDIVNATRVEMDMQRVLDLYLENGYFSNSFIRSMERDPNSNTVYFNLSIVERNRAYIENIILIGNDKTKDHVILREIPMEPGDVFSKAKVMDAMRNLMNLQYFIVMPDTAQGSEENLIDLIFLLEEQQTTTIQFGLSFSGSPDPDTFPISGLLEWNDNNLAGSGNQLGVRLNSSIVDTSEFAANYTHRWVFGLPLDLGISFSAVYSKRFATTDNRMRFNGDEPDAFPDGFNNYNDFIKNNRTPARIYLMPYEQWFLSLGFSTGYRWLTPAGILGLSGGIKFGMINNSYDDIYRPFDPILREGNNTWTPRNSLSLSLSLDQRDIFYDPSKGYFASQRFGIYGFFEEETEHYLRSDTKAEYYFTLFDIPVKWSDTNSFKSVFAFHTGLSFLFAQPGRNDVNAELPAADSSKLAVDGMFVGRGWSSEYRNKGLLLLDTWVELRFPIVRGILSFDLFYDMAGVETREGYYFGDNESGKPNFTVNNLRFSFGGGFRFTLPQFPIRLSFAKRYKYVEDQFTWMPGALFYDPSNPDSGIDLVISFALSF